MPLDAVFLSGLRKQLSDVLTGMKIDRVRQPERDTVLLSLRGNGQNRTLLINFGSGNARVCFTEESFENPPQPPMFCMLLRKHLIGARIIDVRQPERERMLRFSLLCYDEMGTPVEKSMAVELLGRNANLVLIDGDGRILDAARRVDAEMSPLRQLLPGLIYHEPPKPDAGRFSGLSPLVRRELEFRGLPPVPESLETIEMAPYMLMENGAPKDYTFLPILQYGPMVDSVRYDGWSELLESFYAQRDRAEHQKNRARSMTKLVRNARARTERKLSLRIEELGATADREQDKRRGDLITANIWRMRVGQETLVTEDFYEDDTPQITIPLDARKTPQQNAAAYYRQYTKKKAAQEHLTSLIESNREELEYLGSIAEEIERAQTQSDLDDIRRELEAAGYLRASARTGKKVKKPKPVPPMSFRTTAGLTVYVGWNNVQNDELTFKLARRTDLWLHAQKLHGAHVILCCCDAEPDERSVYEAACLAAYYSEGKQSGRVAVDAAQVRFVKKPRGARPGKVIYTDQRTILAEPKSEP